MPKITYDIGYAGIVKIQEKPIMATGGSMSVNYQPIYTTGVWGAGYKTASSKTTYAPNYVTLQSSVNYQLTVNISSILQNWAFDNRNNSNGFSILPNGVSGYTGNGYCTGASFSASQDSIVTGDISVKSGDVSSQVIVSSDSSGSDSGYLTQIAGCYDSVYPFWASSIKYGSASDTARGDVECSLPKDDVLDWNASYSSDLVFIMTCCGSNIDNTIQAKYCALGQMQASGSFTIFKVNEWLDPASLRKIKNINISINSCNGKEGSYTIGFGAIILQSGSTDIQSGTSLIQSSFNFSGLADGTKAPMYFSSSDSSSDSSLKS